jgi:hypothetical protein
MSVLVPRINPAEIYEQTLNLFKQIPPAAPTAFTTPSARCGIMHGL